MFSRRLCPHPNPRPPAKVSVLWVRALVPLGAPRPLGKRFHDRGGVGCSSYDDDDGIPAGVPHWLCRVLIYNRDAQHDHLWLSRW